MMMTRKTEHIVHDVSAERATDSSSESHYTATYSGIHIPVDPGYRDRGIM